MVLHAVQRHPVIDRGADALLQGILLVDAAIIGEQLDRAGIVELEQLGHQIADRVVAQVRGQIADAQAGRRLPRSPMVAHDVGGGDRHFLLVVAPRQGQMQHRIVGMHRRRQRREIGGQQLARLLVPGHDHRPFAQALAGGQIVLQRLALLAVQFDALPQHQFGGLVPVAQFEHAGGLVERRHLVQHRRGVELSHAAQHLVPLAERQVGRAQPLIEAAEIDMGGHEVGLDGDGPVQVGPRPVDIVHIGQEDAVIEEHRVSQRVLLIMGEPGVVELLDPGRPGGVADHGRGRGEVHGRQGAGGGAFQISGQHAHQLRALCTAAC